MHNEEEMRKIPPALEVDDLFQSSIEDKRKVNPQDEALKMVSESTIRAESVESSAHERNEVPQDDAQHYHQSMGHQDAGINGSNSSYNPGGTTIINNYIQAPVGNNTLGLTGFILSIVAFVLSWIPILGGLLWLVGAILSIIGLFKAPRGFAIAGTIISFLMIFVFLFFFMGFMMLAAMNTY